MPTPEPVLVARLRDAGCVFAEEEATLLGAASDDPGVVEALVARRVAGEPLEHLLGWAQFAGLRVLVGPGVFVPRRRTEHLLDQATARLAGRSEPVVVDLCCGSGAIALALAARVSLGELHAADVDPAAVACARLNLGSAGGSVHEGDLLDALPSRLRGRVDVLVANVPYVPTPALATMPPEARDHEPRVALDGGADGLDVVRRVAAAVASWLVPGGWVLVETSAAQAPPAAALFRAAGLDPVVEVAADGTHVVAARSRRAGTASGC